MVANLWDGMLHIDMIPCVLSRSTFRTEQLQVTGFELTVNTNIITIIIVIITNIFVKSHKVSEVLAAVGCVC